MPVGQSSYGGGRSTTTVQLPSVDYTPLDLAKILIGRESEYLAKGPRSPVAFGPSGPRPGDIGVRAAAPAFRAAPADSARYGGLGSSTPQSRTDPTNPYQQMAQMLAAQTLIPMRPAGLGLPIGNLPIAPGAQWEIDWNKVPLPLRGQYEGPIAQAALARAQANRLTVLGTGTAAGPGETARARLDDIRGNLMSQYGG